jgi:phosphoglycolate phosphatase
MATLAVGANRVDDIELFVFDKDGTIIDLYNYWYHMVELRSMRLCEMCGLSPVKHRDGLMSAMGIDIPNKRLKPEGPVGLLPREIVQKAAEDYIAKYGCKDTASVCFKVFKEVDAASLGLLDKFIKPLDGAVKLLKEIKSRGAKIAIATTDKTERAEVAMDFLKIRDLVDAAVGADKVNRSKPAPDMLEFIGSKLGVRPSHSVIIGDAKTDIQMGINANFKASIAVCSGLTAREDLEHLTPYVVEDISKLIVE